MSPRRLCFWKIIIYGKFVETYYNTMEVQRKDLDLFIR